MRSQMLSIALLTLCRRPSTPALSLLRARLVRRLIRIG
jgi:hypothetical protein